MAFVALTVYAPRARAGDDGAWLEKAAEQAIVAGQYPRAVALLRGLDALRPHDPSPMYRLAEVFTLAGQYEEAISEYHRFAERPEADPARKSRATEEAQRLEQAPAPFVESIFHQSVATPEAARLFREGKHDAQSKDYQAALAELQASLLVDPDLPGPYRLLGAVYERTGDKMQERLFLADYLRVRPEGHIADIVRGKLKSQHVLGTVSLDASFPCQVYVNGRSTGKKTPLRGYLLPAGKYIIGLENETYHLVRNLRVEVVTGKDVHKSFEFGVLSTKLDPWARVRVDGKDIGLWDEAGIPAGRHQISYVSHDGSKQKQVDLVIKPGSHEKLSW